MFFSLKTTVSRRIQDGAKLFTTVYLMSKFTWDKNNSVYSMYYVISYLQESPNVVEDADVIYLCYFFVNFVLYEYISPFKFLTC